MPVPAHFYIRHTKIRKMIAGPTEYETHRCGCIVIEKKSAENPSDAGWFTVSYSLVSPDDQFVAKVAREIAYGRLRTAKSFLIKGLPENFGELATELRIDVTLKKFKIDYALTEEAYSGAVKDFTAADPPKVSPTPDDKPKNKSRMRVTCVRIVHKSDKPKKPRSKMAGRTLRDIAIGK